MPPHTQVKTGAEQAKASAKDVAEFTKFIQYFLLAFGVIGYGLRYFAVPFLPMVLGVVLGFMVESNYRRALVLSNGDLTTFIRNPIAASLLAAAVIVLGASLLRQAKQSRAGAR